MKWKCYIGILRGVFVVFLPLVLGPAILSAGPDLQTFAYRGPEAGQSPLFGPDLPLDQIPNAHSRMHQGRIIKPRIVVEKTAHRLLLYSAEQLLKAYRIELGQGGLENRVKGWDGRTPEGTYFICRHNDASHYSKKALVVNYPNLDDVERAVKNGVLTPQAGETLKQSIKWSQTGCRTENTKLGGPIEIHGQHPKYTQELAEVQKKNGTPLPSGQVYGDEDPATKEIGQDWTLGCIALTNPDIREMFSAVSDGTPIVIQR